MTASNHFLTGALIGVLVPQAWIAVPAAVASHFVLDALPQYGYEGPRERTRFKLDMFRWVLAIDLMLVVVQVVTLAAVVDEPLLIAYGLAAYSPDLMWIYRFSVMQQAGLSMPRNLAEKLHAGIQRLESPWGLLLEVPYFLLGFYWLITLTA